jgi:uncharacterized protein
MSNRNKDHDHERAVSHRAYAIWEEEGRPDGKHLEHWQQALTDIEVLHETGYDMVPVNPTEAGSEIRGLRVYESLAAIDRPVDMVEVFRNSAALPGIAREAIDIGAKVLWAQLGVRNDEAARLAEAAGLKVVMNRCPKIELFRPFWKPRLQQAI